MRVAFDKDNNRIIADSGVRYRDCFCPKCGEPVIHRIGQKNIPHFAHKAKTNCPDDKDNKSEWHRHMQELFPIETNEVVFHDNNNNRIFIADVYLKESNTVIEFQHSPISLDDFKDRTEFHLSEGRRVIWVFDVSRKDSQGCNLKNPILCQDRKHYMYQWKPNQGIALSSMFGEQGHDQYTNVGIFVYSGSKGDIVHRIIAHAEEYNRIMLSVHPFNLVNIDIDEFFSEELRWANPDEWSRRRIAAIEGVRDTVNQRKLIPLPKRPRHRRL